MTEENRIENHNTYFGRLFGSKDENFAQILKTLKYS
jgi:hypothetical protein